MTSLRISPHDAALPALSVLVDGAEMTPVLTRALGSDGVGRSVDVRPHCLRYKPGTNLVVHYLVGVDDSWHEATAMIARNRNLAKRAAALQNQALACQIDGRAPATSPLYHDDEVGALVQWLPLDIKLPALALRPASLCRHLQAAGVAVEEDCEPAMVAYRPRRRAVLRLGEHIVKIYADPIDFARSVKGLQSVADVVDVRTPDLEAAPTELGLTVQTLLPGSGVSSAATTAGDAGRLMSTFHAHRVVGLEALPPSSQLERAARSANLVAAVMPDLAPRLRLLLATLEELQPAAPTLVRAHGDFHSGQLLEADGALFLIDLDEACQAPAALDVANYAAHLVRGAAPDREAARGCLEALVEGYGHRPDGLAWYMATAVLRRAPFPFRFLDERWPQGITAQVATAEAALSW